jgi:hypothetical protein
LKQRALIVAVTVGLVAGLSFPSCAQQAGIAVAPDRTNQEAHSAELDKADRAAAKVPPPASYSQTLRERIKTDTVLVTFTTLSNPACDSPGCGNSIIAAFLRPCETQGICGGNGPFFDLPKEQHAEEVAVSATYRYNPNVPLRFSFLEAGAMLSATVRSDNSILLRDGNGNMVTLFTATPDEAQNLALERQKQRNAQEQAQREAQKEQETIVEKNMPHNGKFSVKFTLQGDNQYGAILQPVNGGNAFAVQCNAADDNNVPNPSCQRLKRAQIYSIARLAQDSPDAYGGPEVFGTVLVSDPSNKGSAELIYAVAGGSISQAIFSAQEEEETEVLRSKLQKHLKALGFHRNQSQAQVKLILQQNGFSTWRCDSNFTQTDCVTQRPKESPSGYAEVSVIFINRSLWSVEYCVGAETCTSLGENPF